MLTFDDRHFFSNNIILKKLMNIYKMSIKQLSIGDVKKKLILKTEYNDLEIKKHRHKNK